MKIYITAPYQMQKEALAVLHRLEALGHTVTSRWPQHSQKLNHRGAIALIHELEEADMLVILNYEFWERSGSGGRHVELGYALALGKKIVLVGRRSNIFHYLEQVRVIDRIEDL